MSNKAKFAPYVVIPQWCIGQQRDFADLITAISLAGFEGQWIRLSHAQQRELIGKAIFGKRAIKTSAADIQVYRSCCYGLDFDIAIYNNSSFNEAFNRGFCC